MQAVRILPGRQDAGERGAKYQEYKAKHPHSHRKHPGMGALSALELFYALVEAGEL